MRTPLIVGNWKMNKTASEAATFVGELSQHLSPPPTGVELVVAPPFTALESVGRVLGSGSLIQLGAQNLFWETQGAYTGEISAPMLKDLGCRYVILGHSERRTLFGEQGDGIRRKIQAAFAHGLRPILCIGESLAQREAGSTNEVLTQQIHESVSGFSAENLTSLTIAYEPIWAIGTGRSATTEQAVAAHQTIRSVLAATASPVLAEGTRILYGGSVTAQNIASLLASNQVDGALIGGACLQVDSFATIAKLASITRSIGV
ncbi:MAG: triose-phosphate isomerase [Nitrospira sp.]|nr:triose-phosphate isomerase [Nitrospira sp.]MDH4305345.1 triose-phosphate isomerase [Nitrospira sp.]MDH5194144.1 triose-phosphate isomerase [Nitrospira sp.]